MGRDEIERAIGPLEADLPARLPFGCLPAVLGGAALLFALGGVLLDVDRPGGPGRFGPFLMGIAAFLLLGVVGVPFLRRDRLFVGAKGLAEERDDATTVVLWADLGRDWREYAWVPAEGLARSPPLLVLIRGDGRTFRLRPIYDGAEALAGRIRDHLHRNAPARPDDAPPAGPWLHAAATSGLGPVRLVALPDPAAAERFREQVDRDLAGWRFVGRFRPWLVVLVLVVSGWSPNLRPVLAAVLVLMLAGNVAFADYRARALRLTGTVWLVGEHGFALWRAGRVEVVFWDDLGREWFVRDEIEPAERRRQRLPILLKLQNTCLDCLYVTELHPHAAELVTRIRTAVSTHGSPFAPAEPRPVPIAPRTIHAGPPRRSSSTRITTPPAGLSVPPPEPEPGPWLDDERLDAIGPVELVCRNEAVLGGLVFVLLTVPVLLGWLLYVLFQALVVPLTAELAWRLLLGAGLFSWWALAVGYLVVDAWWRYRTRWLLGRNGIARWRPGELIVLPWDGLLADWDVTVRKPGDAPGAPPAWLRLKHRDGRELRFDWTYTGSELLIRRVLRVLAARDAGSERGRP